MLARDHTGSLVLERGPDGVWSPRYDHQWRLSESDRVHARKRRRWLLAEFAVTIVRNLLMILACVIAQHQIGDAALVLALAMAPVRARQPKWRATYDAIPTCLQP